MSWPINPNLNSDILQTDFYSAVERTLNARFYAMLSTEKTVSEITTSFPSFGSVPEIAQMSGATGTGPRPATILKDYNLSGTVYEWQQTILISRLLAKSKPESVRAKTTQMATKAVKGMDKEFCKALISTTALGYDGKALLSTTHGESGASQSNLVTGANITTNYIPTGTEAEVMLSSAVSSLKSFQDDQGTPVNEGASRFIVLCPTPMYIPFVRITDPGMQNYSVDSSGGTGVFRGQVKVIGSAYATTTGLPTGTLDRIFVFCDPSESDGNAMARITLADWEFNTNVNDEGSDDWNKGEGYLRSWAGFNFIPWQWHQVCAHIVT